MKQITWRIATHSADVFGVCSALFELGGMVVMHDPSGCNSTYTTHDEPRWYDTDSQIYISGLTEKEALFGDTQRLYDDVAATIKIQQPRFVCLIPSQMSAMLGLDLRSVAAKLAQNFRIPTFTLPTNSVHYYSQGVYWAMEAVAQRFVDAPPKNGATPNRRQVNLLGFTPLDFALHDPTECIALLAQNGVQVNTAWLMGAKLADLCRASEATANIAVSYGGLGAARVMQEKFGVPFVVGVPWAGMEKDVIAAVERRETTPVYLCEHFPVAEDKFVIGDSILAGSLACLWGKLYGERPRVICGVETETWLLNERDILTNGEDELAEVLGRAKTVVADPLYKVFCAPETEFIPWPQPGLSGRRFRAQMPHLFKKEGNFLCRT